MTGQSAAVDGLAPDLARRVGDRIVGACSRNETKIRLDEYDLARDVDCYRFFALGQDDDGVVLRSPFLAGEHPDVAAQVDLTWPTPTRHFQCPNSPPCPVPTYACGCGIFCAPDERAAMFFLGATTPVVALAKASGRCVEIVDWLMVVAGRNGEDPRPVVNREIHVERIRLEALLVGPEVGAAVERQLAGRYRLPVMRYTNGGDMAERLVDFLEAVVTFGRGSPLVDQLHAEAALTLVMARSGGLATARSGAA